MIEIGRIVVKTAGRDSGEIGIIVDKIDNKFVLVDGNIRRKRCNIMHLEPLDKKIELKKNATHEHIVDELKKLKIDVKEKAKKKRKAKEQKTEEIAPKKSEKPAKKKSSK